MRSMPLLSKNPKSDFVPSVTDWPDSLKQKVLLPENLLEQLAKEKQQGKTIVSLNGSFDLMHAGHLHILYEAASLGDILIVALNTDSSIQRYKDPRRPIIDLTNRVKMMAAIECVSYVTWFDETDPRALLEKIRPNIHVNGSEYGENCVEAPIVKKHGGIIHCVDLVPGLSTSAIIKKIHALESE